MACVLTVALVVDLVCLSARKLVTISKFNVNLMFNGVEVLRVQGFDCMNIITYLTWNIKFLNLP